MAGISIVPATKYPLNLCSCAGAVSLLSVVSPVFSGSVTSTSKSPSITGCSSVGSVSFGFWNVSTKFSASFLLLILGVFI